VKDIKSDKIIERKQHCDNLKIRRKRRREKRRGRDKTREKKLLDAHLGAGKAGNLDPLPRLDTMFTILNRSARRSKAL
jgi:hypothetical protein